MPKRKPDSIRTKVYEELLTLRRPGDATLLACNYVSCRPKRRVGDRGGCTTLSYADRIGRERGILFRARHIEPRLVRVERVAECGALVLYRGGVIACRQRAGHNWRHRNWRTGAPAAERVWWTRGEAIQVFSPD